MGAIAVAIALHAAVLIVRPGVSGGHASAPVASVLAVRILHAASVAPATPTSMEPAPVPAVAPAEQRDASAATKPQTQAAARPPARVEPAVASSDTLAAAPEYALGIMLDPGPRPLDEIDPDYPDTAHLRSGTVVLRLLISDTGHVDDVSVVRAEPLGVFEQAAIEAFAKARFAPGMAGGRAVKSQIRVEVEFMPINRGARISGRSY